MRRSRDVVVLALVFPLVVARPTSASRPGPGATVRADPSVGASDE